MKLFLQKDDGAILEFQEIESASDSADVLLFFCKFVLSASDQKRMEAELSARIGRRCILRSAHITRVAGIRSGAKQSDYRNDSGADRKAPCDPGVGYLPLVFFQVRQHMRIQDYLCALGYFNIRERNHAIPEAFLKFRVI